MENPEKQAQWFQVIKAAMSYTQLGLSIVTPLVLCMLLAYWLQQKFSLGGWIMAVALAVGLLSMLLSFYKIIRDYLAESRKKAELLKKGRSISKEADNEADRH